VFLCTYSGCDRSFTKQGNLTVHIRTVHEGEKRFVCGETDLSSSKKVAGWDAIGCGNRYGSKLALEEHIRTAHMGLQNAKAERRQRLGLNKKPSHSSISTLAALTGQGYVEETGRHIACFYDQCPHRFHRDYDLWVHMTSKHGCSEDEVQGLFMQRALLADDSGPGGNSLGMYGLGLDQEGQSFFQENYTAGDHSSDMAFGSQSNDSNYLPGQQGLNTDYLMQDDFSAGASGEIDSMLSGRSDMAMIDPVLAYNLMEQ
jgi:hypothetical protein